MSGAAERLNRTKQAVSHAIQTLEQNLQVKLFERNTRSMRLTESGKLLYQYSQQIEEQSEQAVRALHAFKGIPQGPLRISCTYLFAESFLIPVIAKYLKEYPQAQVFLNTTETQENMIDNQIDLVIRIGKLADSSLIARRLMVGRLICCASPEYLSQAPDITTPHSLKYHQALILQGNKGPVPWIFEQEQEEIQVKPAVRLQINSTNLLFEAACNGLGIAVLPEFLCQKALSQGQLVEVLPHWNLPKSTVYALFMKQNPPNLNLRTFLNFLIDAMNQIG
jgi:DNA-binding transcriptional LysR family regulator